MCEPRLLASFEGLVTRSEVVGVVWGPNYAKRSNWGRLGAGLHEPSLVALFGGWHTRTNVVGIV